jgi:putative restriction endonuclease
VLIHTTGEEALGMVVAAGFLKSPASHEADDEPDAHVAPSAADEREQVLRAIKVRRGQSAFRRGLIKRYGSRCLVTGCELESVRPSITTGTFRATAP